MAESMLELLQWPWFDRSHSSWGNAIVSSRWSSLIVALCIVVVYGDAACRQATAIDRVVMRRDGIEQALEGRIVVTATDGGVMLQARDGALWMVQADEVADRSSDDRPFTPFTADEVAATLKSQLPTGFEIYQTKHYVLCFNTSRAYAQWCGTLFERLYQGFQNYWNNRGFELHEPEFPMAAIVFADRPTYARFARGELGDGVDSIIGYYSLRSNRMTMFDLTGTAGTSAMRSSPQLIVRTLSQPDAAKTVATIVHEATHQIAFNCGLHQRYADIPLWVSEGVAVYFETPDLNSTKGWGTIGAVHRVRLAMFRAYLARRPADSLQTLLADDKRMRDPATAGSAYAEAWALNYFLINARSKQYADYLKTLAAKGPLVVDTPEKRLAEFRNAFGDDLTTLDRDFLKYVSRLR